MELMTKVSVGLRETSMAMGRGQTMTEYALILAAIAIVVFGVYQTMGSSISSLVSGINSYLTAS